MKEIYVEQIETYPEDIVGCVINRSDYLQKYVNPKIPKDAFSVQCVLSSDGQKILSNRFIKNFGI